MADLPERLKQLLVNRTLITGAQLGQKREGLKRQQQTEGFDIDACVPGEIIEDASGSFYLVRRDFPLSTAQGTIELGAVLDVLPEHIALAACDPGLEEFDPSTALFIDAETTGLAGGTGTVPFLVGVGYFAETRAGNNSPPTGVFRLEQCFMRDFDEEEPMLRYLEPLFARCRTVVSFNGKSFDVPLLRTRFITNRLPFRLDAALHFDLVHAARRFWKLRIKDCSLGNVERTILGICRQGDVPGAEIPQIWFDYLRTRDARDLQRVFYHHRMDVLSLVALTAWLSQCLDVPGGEGFEHAEDRLSVLRLHFRQKRYEEAAAHARQLLEREPEGVVRCECLEMFAFACKRLLDWPRMEETWQLIIAEFPRHLLARLELAKHYEHRMRDLHKARRVCEEALAHFDAHGDSESPERALFQNRLNRIGRKLSKGGREDWPEEGE